MNREVVKKVAGWAAVLTIFAFTGASLGVKYAPEKVSPDRDPVYTQAAYLEKEREAAYWKLRWREADSVLMDIARAGRRARP